MLTGGLGGGAGGGGGGGGGGGFGLGLGFGAGGGGTKVPCGGKIVGSEFPGCSAWFPSISPPGIPRLLSLVPVDLAAAAGDPQHYERYSRAVHGSVYRKSRAAVGRPDFAYFHLETSHSANP